MGAYGTAITVTYFEQSVWLGILVAILAAVVLALLLGVPTLRLRADYLAIVTIAGAEIIRLCVRSVTFGALPGGSTCLNSFADGSYDPHFLPGGSWCFGPWHFRSDTWWWILICWHLRALCALLLFP